MLLLLRRPPSDRDASLSQRLSKLLVGLGLGLATAADAASITGVCPDGSVFVVRNPASIPCRDARRIEPHQVPPMRPENLPRSYLWDVHREKQNENNPYNLVDRAAKVRASLAKGGSAPPVEALAPSDDGHEATGGGAPPQVASAPPSRPATPAPSKPDLGLTDGEVRDLFYLVEVSQQSAPATFATQVGGQEALRVSFAHSQAFEARVRSATSVDGRVVLFTVQPNQQDTFRPNFTFVQGQTSFHPQAGDARQLGVLVGRLGELNKDDLVLGYAVLPGSIDIARPVDLYWDDRRLAVTFQQ
jgi:hypothetical protein